MRERHMRRRRCATIFSSCPVAASAQNQLRSCPPLVCSNSTIAWMPCYRRLWTLFRCDPFSTLLSVPCICNLPLAFRFFSRYSTLFIIRRPTRHIHAENRWSRPSHVHEKRGAGQRQGAQASMAARRVPRTISRAAFFRPAEDGFRSECAESSVTFWHNPDYHAIT
jgi:hypothetical protein